MDSKGRQYIRMSYNKADKTNHGLDHREDPKKPRLYENEGPCCPMRSYLKYISKLSPECPSLFQRPIDKFQPAHKTWYPNKAVGVNTLQSFMSRLSEKACLSQRYTNHCVRAFVGSHLHKKGYSSRAIMSVTGHRNVSSLNSYVKPSDEERYSISKALNYAGYQNNEENISPSSIKRQETRSETLPAASEPAAMAISSDLQESEHGCSTNESVTTNTSTSSRDIDMNMSSISDSRALHMFTGSIASSTITVNVYNAK
ncbi:uncharacterized protein LOC128546541 [Mercenaria mercenaria]|uniref:uncharacterized protein LOC128546541 n=1 Tax=Mercenaria mercenaria TaxID=6596 RepID=UPI00234EDC04|nr:uncharacterized protein LOC128546541 [Mercenaria mercenaria]